MNSYDLIRNQLRAGEAGGEGEVAAHFLDYIDVVCGGMDSMYAELRSVVVPLILDNLNINELRFSLENTPGSRNESPARVYSYKEAQRSAVAYALIVIYMFAQPVSAERWAKLQPANILEEGLRRSVQWQKSNYFRYGIFTILTMLRTPLVKMSRKDTLGQSFDAESVEHALAFVESVRRVSRHISFEKLSDLDKSVQEVSRVLRPEGVDYASYELLTTFRQDLPLDEFPGVSLFVVLCCGCVAISCTVASFFISPIVAAYLVFIAAYFLLCSAVTYHLLAPVKLDDSKLLPPKDYPKSYMFFYNVARMAVRATLLPDLAMRISLSGRAVNPPEVDYKNTRSASYDQFFPLGVSPSGLRHEGRNPWERMGTRRKESLGHYGNIHTDSETPKFGFHTSGVDGTVCVGSIAVDGVWILENPLALLYASETGEIREAVGELNSLLWKTPRDSWILSVVPSFFYLCDTQNNMTPFYPNVRQRSHSLKLGGNGNLKMKYHWWQLIYLVFIYTVYAAGLSLMWSGFILNEPSFLAVGGATLVTFTAAVLTSEKDEDGWLNKAVSGYWDVGNGVGSVGRGTQDVMIESYRNGVSPYSNGGCWAGNESTGTIPNGYLTIATFDTKEVGSRLLRFARGGLGSLTGADGVLHVERMRSITCSGSATYSLNCKVGGVPECTKRKVPTLRGGRTQSSTFLQ